VTNTVSGMQRHRGKMFRSRPYATALDDFDFFLSFPTLLKFKKKTLFVKMMSRLSINVKHCLPRM
jgi:hypothetical protein